MLPEAESTQEVTGNLELESCQALNFHPGPLCRKYTQLYHPLWDSKGCTEGGLTVNANLRLPGTTWHRLVADHRTQPQLFLSLLAAGQISMKLMLLSGTHLLSKTWPGSTGWQRLALSAQVATA